MLNFKKRMDLYLFSREASFVRFKNLIKIVIEEKLGRSRISNYPYKLTMDPCNTCNLKCPLCPTGKNEKGRGKGMMKFSDFKKIIDEIGKYLYVIDLFGWGEPFLNKDLFKMVKYARMNNIRVNVSSNLSILDEKIVEELIKSDLNLLIISSDGASQETYKKYHVGGDFNKVLDNIKLISKKKKELGRKNPLLQWRFIVMKHNEHEIKKAEKITKELGIDRLEIAQLRSDMGSELFKSDEEMFEEVKDRWLPEDETYSRFDYGKRKRKKQREICPFLWRQATVNWNGNISPCCGVYYEKFDFGNVFQEGSFMKIWNNEKYTSARKKTRGKKSEINTICDNCVKNGFLE